MKAGNKLIMTILAPLNLHTLYYSISTDQENVYFSIFKAVESITESLVVSIITCVVLVQGNIRYNTALFASSLSLFLLSMAYSFSMIYLEKKFKWHTLLFYCTLVNDCWEVIVFGIVIAFEPESYGWLALVAYLVVTYVCFKFWKNKNCEIYF